MATSSLAVPVMASLNVEVMQVNLSTGRKYSYKNNKFPSVNTVIDKFQEKEFLKAWREKVGEEEAKKIINQCAVRGTHIHNAAEKFLQGKEFQLIGDEPKYFKNLLPFLEIIQPIYLEQRVIWQSDKNEAIGFGGTLDICCGIPGGKLFFKDKTIALDEDTIILGDFKTWKKAKSPEYLVGNCLQIAGYSAAVNKITGGTHRVNKGLIIGCTSRGLYLYYINSRAMMYYWKAFSNMVEAYFYNGSFNWKAFRFEAIGLYREEDSWKTSEYHYLPSRVFLENAN